MNNKYDGFYSSTKWLKVRKTALQRDSGLCQRCMQFGLYTPATIVHHKEELNEKNAKDPSIALSLDNLICLCKDCHDEIHNRIQHRRYKIDENGDIIEVLDECEDDLLDENRKNVRRK